MPIQRWWRRIREWIVRVRIRRAVSRLRPAELTDSRGGMDDGNAAVEPDLSPLADPFDGFAVDVPIEDSIDLHTFAPDETRMVLDAYITAARENGFREVRIIHGRGRGVQRRITRSFLAKHPGVEQFFDAPPERGGWGATIAILTPGS